MLNLRIVEGPLEDRLNEAILSRYNDLTASHISLENFRRWTQESPEGPACHALLQTDGGELVGHCCLFPFRMKYGDAQLIAAKAEYYFIEKGYRSEKIHGFERSPMPAAVVILEQLYRHCRTHWDPFIVSSPFDVLHRMAGCRPVTFPLFECLLILRPVRSACATPNLTAKQRALLFLAGVVQRTAWSMALPFLPRTNGTCSVRISDEKKPVREPSTLRFAEDKDFLAWHYPESQYFRVGASQASGDDFIIVKNGSESKYLRVCQYHLDSESLPLSSVLVNLIATARAQNALGVRWAVYGEGEVPARLIRAMRKLGFLCARRERVLMVYTSDRELFQPSRWNMSDSFVSFDN